MRAWYLLVGMLLLAACNRGGEGEIRTIPLTYLSSEDALKLVTPYLSEEIAVSASQAGSPAIALRGPDARVNQLADLIGRFDRPVPNVQLRFQVIEANGFTSSDTAIADVEAVLRDLFRFRGYRLVAESLVRSEAPGNAMQRLVGEDGTPFEIRAQLTRLLQQDTARAVTLEVQLDAYGTAVLGTTLTVPSGQTVVVGTARSGREGNTLILVVRPRIE